eukprot:gnl/MRDRNA2_/MRDRNA2_219702_c0_seq1.p1 gnl/MRDRNA2_/MRDRNA2_219702_c0~~gnl/MRDRNA2_/MRDRNA2_219702_c0_seq1.p1  ORF type:complete len:288 (+),score=39.19 gnl/MRDRNA2_/MRDRNA2_219702_c0_seq1:74-937(+)
MMIRFISNMVWLFSGDARSILLNTSWGQRWAYAQYAPACGKSCHDQGEHWRLGCASTALAQIAYFHRLCPMGSVGYTVPGFSETRMDFDAETKKGLCMWQSFADAPPNTTSDSHMKAVAKYEYAAALILQKTWGTGDYELTHEARAKAAMEHYGFENITIISLTNFSADEVLAAIIEEIDFQRPLKMQIHMAGNIHSNSDDVTMPPRFHHVAVDGYHVEANKTFRVHINAGHSGFDNGWYDWNAPICLKHYPNGTTPADGSCAALYNDMSYRELWRIRPASAPSLLV